MHKHCCIMTYYTVTQLIMRTHCFTPYLLLPGMTHRESEITWPLCWWKLDQTTLTFVQFILHRTGLPLSIWTKVISGCLPWYPEHFFFQQKQWSKGSFILHCNCVAVPIYWLLLITHVTTASLHLGLKLINFMPHCTAYHRNFCAVGYSAAMQRTCDIVWTDLKLGATSNNTYYNLMKWGNCGIRSTLSSLTKGCPNPNHYSLIVFDDRVTFWL